MRPSLLRRLALAVALLWDRAIQEVCRKLWLVIDCQQGRNAIGVARMVAGWSFFDQIGVISGNLLRGDESPARLAVQLDLDLPVFAPRLALTATQAP